MILALPLAYADEPVGSLRMRPNEMVLPTIAAQVSVAGRLDPAHPIVTDIGVDTAGIHGFLPGVRWLSVGGGYTFDPTDPSDPRAFSVRGSVWRRVNQSQPVVAAQDLRLLSASFGRDRDLDMELGLVARAAEWSGGLYLPANHPGDIDARIIVGARALGVRWEKPATRPEFVGAEIGGISAEMVYGRKLAERVSLTGHLGGRADWAVGSAGGGFATRTDTTVWAAGVLDVGEHHSVRLVGETKTAKDDRGWSAFVPSLTTAWRVTW